MKITKTYEVTIDTDTGKVIFTEAAPPVVVPPVVVPPVVVPPTAADIDQRVVAVATGQQVTLVGSWRNLGNTALPVQQVVIAVREPGATHASGPFDLDASNPAAGTIAPGGTGMSLQAVRFFDKAGKWTVYPTYQTADGQWHDGADVTVTIAGTVTPPVEPPPVVTPPVQPGNLRHAMKARLGSQIWQKGWGGSDPTGSNEAQYLKDIALLGTTCIRMMDAIPVNNSTVKTWAERNHKDGIPMETLIEQCNKASADLWMCHPFLADDDYFTKTAELIKSNLNPDLRVFVELSNEVWNGGFQQAKQAEQLGAAQKLPGSNQWYQAIAYELFRALQLFSKYQQVFGASAMGSKVIRTFGQSGNLDLSTEALKEVYKSTKWNASQQKIDMLAIAPYIGNGRSGSSETLASWNAEADRHVNDEFKTAKSQMQQYGIPYLGLYEFGQHHLQNADAFAKNQTLAYEAYKSMLTKYAAQCNGPMCLYTSHGTWGAGGSWGVFNKVGQSLADSPKARAVNDFVKTLK